MDLANKIKNLFRKKHQPLNVDDVATGSIENEGSADTSDQITIYAEKQLALAGCVVSDVGRIRENNEDNYLLDVHINEKAHMHSQAQGKLAQTDGSWRAYCVFDGMGGGEKGEVASGLTAKVFQNACAHLKGSMTKSEVDDVFRKCFLESNNNIVRLQQKFKVYGTTGTVLCTNGIEFKIYHLGDSRAYLLRNGQMLQMTRDQTLAQMKIDVGLYDENDPQAEIERHKLTEYIGRDWTKENLRPVESEWMNLQPDDRILLCSDGLYDMCSDAEITEILNGSASAKEAAKNLVSSAITNGGEDNVTCVVLMVTDPA